MEALRWNRERPDPKMSVYAKMRGTPERKKEDLKKNFLWRK